LIPEFESEWSAGDLTFAGTFTDYDADSQPTDPGLLTRASRLKVDREIADLLPADSVISQVATGDRFAIKFRRLSGVGIVELDLERIKDRKVSERSF